MGLNTRKYNMYNYSIGLNAVVREFQMEHLCCSCSFQSIMLCVRMHVMPIKHWASAFFDLDSQMEYAGVAPPALAEMPEFTSGSGLLFL